MDLWTDSHNHLQDPRLGDARQAIAAAREAGVARCIVNATCEADWDTVGALATAHPDMLAPAFGIHPWRADTARDGWEDRLGERLRNHPRASIGECGLDRWVTTPDIAIQLPVFIAHLRLASALHRPLTIHCLKAWEPMTRELLLSPPPAGFLMHSFNGSLETARRLLPIGAYFSFSGHFLHERKSAIREVFQRLPKDRILLETDAPDMVPPDRILPPALHGSPNQPANLPAIGHALADFLDMPPAELAALTRANAARLFPW